jgi:hypothetical protein
VSSKPADAFSTIGRNVLHTLAQMTPQARRIVVPHVDRQPYLSHVRVRFQPIRG